MTSDEIIRVLLVDDDEDEFILHRDLLAGGSGLRYRLDWIATYDDGLAAVRAGGHDAYLVDFRLGERTGVDLLREAREEGCDRAMIILTGQDDANADRSAMASGASDYLVKGEVNAAALERAIRYAIERTRILGQLRFQAEILKNVHDAVFYVNEEGIVRDWNEGAARIFDWSREEALGRSLMEICPHPSGHPFTRKIVPAIRKDGVAEELIHCRLASGREVFVRAKVTPMRQSGEEGYVFCASDVSKEKRLEAEIVRIAESEQRRIGQDLHDDLCSQLSGIGCLAKVLEQRLRNRQLDEAGMMADISEMVAQAGTRAREIAKGLVPTVLETQGLAGALRELAMKRKEMFGVNCVAAIAEDSRVDGLSEAISIQLYRIAQEAVTNAVRHSDAEVIELSIEADDVSVVLRVCDDGRGMAGERLAGGMGLMTMQRRAELIGAEFSVQASPGGGTVIRCVVPFET